ncbi:MAG: FAD:protein FMN transferase [Candidatus Zapsychrus exili]|nr:FAD:protein FMN transferase [Candidatus Zapsychrus exili]
MNKISIKWIALFVVVVLIVAAFFLLFLIGDTENEKYSETSFDMGTVIRLDVCVDKANENIIDEVYDAVLNRIEDISIKMSSFDKNSDIYNINNSNLKPVVVSGDTFYLIKNSIRFSQLTDGAFDITVGPLIKLWKKSEKQGIAPIEENLKDVLRYVGYENIKTLVNNNLKLLKRSTSIDLGAIAKGYAVDEAARIFREHGINNFLIDAGGDIYAGGLNCDGELWKVGIRDPRNGLEIIDIVEISDMAITTSGDYEQFYEIDGKKFSHIINPKTGYPEQEIISATVIAPKAKDADVFSTALCVLGKRRGADLIDSLGVGYASFIIEQSEDGLDMSESVQYKNFKAKN